LRAGILKNQIGSALAACQPVQNRCLGRDDPKKEQLGAGNSSTATSPKVLERKTIKLESRERAQEFKKLYEITGVVGVGGGGTVYGGVRRYDGLKVAIKQVPKQKVKRWGRVQGKMVPIEFELLDKVSDGHKGNSLIR